MVIVAVEEVKVAGKIDGVTYVEQKWHGTLLLQKAIAPRADSGAGARSDGSHSYRRNAARPPGPDACSGVGDGSSGSLPGGAALMLAPANVDGHGQDDDDGHGNAPCAPIPDVPVQLLIEGGTHGPARGKKDACC